MREEQLFHQVLDLSPADRDEFLETACGDDLGLRQRVEVLLAAHGNPGGFLEKPAVGVHAAATLVTTSTETPGTQIGPYKIREQLGEGGMGVVYVAEQTEPVRRKVALKIIKPGMDSKEVIARFEAERQALAMMSHPNIAKILDGGTTDNGRPYFVMELVKGIPITEYCDQQRLDMRQRLELFATVCQAVQHAHQKGIIHRDLKPSNVLVELHDVAPVPKVIDFGIAKATNQQLTQQTVYTQFAQLVGTPLYMSPEQAQLSGMDVDTRSDVYSLGVMLYELLTGITPFDESTLSSVGLDEMRRIIREDEPARPSYKVSTLDNETMSTISDRRKTDPRQLSLSMQRELDWIVMRRSEKDRTRRYESPSALAQDIQRYLEDEPVQACPPSVGYRLRKYARRHRGLLTTVAVMTATLLIATGVSLSYAFQADEERGKAVTAQKQSDQNFTAAMEAIDKLLEHASSPELAEVPQVQSVRKKILEDVLVFYDKYSEASFDADNLRLRSAITRRNLGQLLASMEKPHEALEQGEQALLVFQELCEKEPSNGEYPVQLAKTHSFLGWVKAFRLRNYADALEEFKQAKILWELIYKKTHSEQSLAEMIISTRDISEMYGKLRRKEEQFAILQKASEMLEELPQDSQHYWPFIRVESALADVIGEKDPDEARRLWVDAIARSRSKLNDRNKKHQHVYLLLDATDSFFRKHDPARAQALVSEAVETADELTRQYPSITKYRKQLDTAIKRSLELELENLSPFKNEEEVLSWLKTRQVEYQSVSPFHERAASELTRFPDADEALTIAIEQFPKESAYHRYRGAIYRERGEYDLALRDLNLAVELRQDDDQRPFLSRSKLFRETGEFGKATQDLDKYVELSGDSIDAYFTRGCFYLEEIKDYEKAILDLDKALSLSPAKGFRYKRRALAHFHLGHFEEALADLRAAVRLKPSDGSNFYWIPPDLVAQCPDETFRNGLLALADKTVDDHDSAYVRVGRGGILAAMGRDREAMVDFDKAVEMNPGKYEWRARRIKFYGDRAQWANLHLEIKESLELKADYFYLHYQLALAALGCSDSPQYQLACQQMLTQFADSKHSVETYFTAWTCALAPHALNDYQPAIELARHAVEKEPGNQQYLNGLGAILMRASQYPEAKSELTKALQVSTDSNTSPSYIRYLLAMTEIHLGNTEAAQKHLIAANKSAETELADSPGWAWNRKLTLEVLRKEAEALLQADNLEREYSSSRPPPPPLPQPVTTD